MPCAFYLRTDTQATSANQGGTWTYLDATAWTVKVDGVSTTLNQNDTIGSNDNPQIETDGTHTGNTYNVRYTIAATAGCSEVSADYAISVQEEPCAIGDGSVDICEGSTTPTTLFDYLDTSACGVAPTIDEWSVVSGDGSGVNTTTGVFDPTGYVAGNTIVVQAKILGSSGGICATCNDATANVTINITAGADAGSGGTFTVCA